MHHHYKRKWVKITNICEQILYLLSDIKKKQEKNGKT